MTIRELRKEIEKIKKIVENDSDNGIVIVYKGELKNKKNSILHDSIIAIDGYDVLTLSKEEIQAVIDKAKVRFLFPDNG